MSHKTISRLVTTLLACTLAYNATADTLTIQSEIDKVTVYKQGALINRKAHVKLPAGVTTLKLPLLSPELEKKTVQVAISNEDISLGKVEIDMEMPNRKIIARQNDSLGKISTLLADSIRLIDAYNSVLYHERKILLDNHNIGGKKGFNAEQLSGVASFLRKDLNEIEDLQLKYAQQREKQALAQQGIGQEILLLDERSMNPKSVAYITLVANHSAETNVEVKYVVKEAEWTPFFELRVTEDKPTLEVTKKVMVLQKSKEDWENVQMTVTRTNPSDNNSKPELKRYTLPYNSSQDYNHSQNGGSNSCSEKKMVKVMGNVRDYKGSIQGVLISCTANNASTQSDASGFYEILVPEGSSLSFTHATHNNVVRTIPNSSKVVNVTMQEDYQKIYGNNRFVVEVQEDAAYEESEDDESSSDNRMRNSGQPGAESTVRIRGVSSLTGKDEPLYVIDGMPMISGSGDGSSANPLASINPDDIVSMEVLRDASSTAIYGSRAANGIILITTKKGSKGGSNLYQSTFSKLQDYTAEATALNTIPSDGSAHEALLNTELIPAKYTYYAAPKITPNVYMLAEVPNWHDYELLKGKLRIFLNNTYIGESYWNPIEIQDTLHFSVGVDRNIAVERTLQSTNHKKNLLKSNKVTRDWLITVKNNKEMAIDVTLEDQIPVAVNDNAKVSLTQSSNATVNEKEGILKWILHLAPGEKREIKVSYEVTLKYDFDYEQLLNNNDL